MTKLRKSFEAREKDLRLAIHRIERGRSHTKATKLSVSAVAREAGVTPALIHNHYSSIAEEIRAKVGATSRQQRDAKVSELKDIQAKNRDLRQQLSDAGNQVSKLASINEMLLMENSTLRASVASGARVVPIRS